MLYISSAHIPLARTKSCDPPRCQECWEVQSTWMPRRKGKWNLVNTQQSPASPCPLLSASRWTGRGVLFLEPLPPTVTPWAPCSQSDTHFSSLCSDHSVLAFHSPVTSLPPETSVWDLKNFFYSITSPFLSFPRLPESLSPLVLLPQPWPIFCAISALRLGLPRAAESDYIQPWELVPFQIRWAPWAPFSAFIPLPLGK